jgi:DNA invertase Pin-like site-specific DNA recombinase
VERAAVYARVSQDRGETTSVEEQLAECEREADRRGWDLADRYEDRNKSASKPGTVRPAYQRLLADVRAGRVTRLMVYMTDRLYRQPRELEDLIDLAEQRPLAIATCRSGDLDLGTPEGRAFARNAATWNKLEVEKLSERSGRGRAAKKANGGWLGGGAVPYGYDRVKDENGKVKEHRVVRSEAAVLKEAVRRVLRGDSMNAIVRDLNARGVKPRKGDRWLPSRLRATLTAPFLAGLYPDGTAGDWPAIISADERVLLLARLPRRSGERPDRRYALSGIAVCSECGTKLLGSGGAYRCMARNGGCGKVRVAARHVDEYVEEQMLSNVPEPEGRPGATRQREDTASPEVQVLGPAEGPCADRTERVDWGARRAGHDPARDASGSGCGEGHPRPGRDGLATDGVRPMTPEGVAKAAGVTQGYKKGPMP